MHLQQFQQTQSSQPQQFSALRLGNTIGDSGTTTPSSQPYRGVVECEDPYDPLEHDPLMQPDLVLGKS